MDNGGSDAKDYQNVPPLLAFLVSQKVCTLYELKTIYTFEDALWMYEAVMIPRYNEWKEMEKSQKANK